MKPYILIMAACLFHFNFSSAQTTPYNVVFDITSKDTVDHKMLIRWLNEILKSDPEAKLEVVLYAQALDMVTQGKSVVADDVTALTRTNTIAFRVCEVAMKNQKVEKSQLLPGVETVPDGIYEIILKQNRGYGYIKATR